MDRALEEFAGAQNWWSSVGHFAGLHTISAELDEFGSKPQSTRNVARRDWVTNGFEGVCCQRLQYACQEERSRLYLISVSR